MSLKVSVGELLKSGFMATFYKEKLGMQEERSECAQTLEKWLLTMGSILVIYCCMTNYLKAK